jgi:hypothetical protein
MKIGTISCLLAACGFAGATMAQVTISQSSNSTFVVPGNSVACAAQDPPAPAPPTTQQTAANFYWRSYQLSSFPVITGPFSVTSVTFAVENAVHPLATQTLRVRLYKDTNGGAPVAVGTDLVQVGENASVSVPNGANQFITAPVTGNFLQSDTLVVSVDSPDYTIEYGTGSPLPQNAVFFIGSNADPETGPSYLSATDCTVPTPTTTAALGFPNMHIILDVTGTIGTGGGCYPDCNNDGQLNLSDFGCFQTAFALGQAYADCNGDGIRNLSDFGCFQTKFALGCP